MERRVSSVRGALVLAAGTLLLVAFAVAGNPRSKHPVEFTLATISGNPSPKAFALAPRPAEPVAAAGPGGAGVIEQGEYPFAAAVGWLALANNQHVEGNAYFNSAFGYRALTNNYGGLV